ncbi:TetR/AcrR family transcriptional regulator [Pacificimonas sp. ICDLI1SI03]
MTGTKSVRKINKLGQSMGPKGFDSRQRLLETAQELLIRNKRLTVADITSVSGLSSSAFYVYFSNINDVLLALSELASEDTTEIHAILDETWDKERLRVLSQRFIKAFYSYWARHREVLALRNYRSDLGDTAFEASRRKAAMPIVSKIAARIQEAHSADDTVVENAIARSIIFYAAVERLAGRTSRSELQAGDLSDDELMRAEAHILTLLFEFK